MNKNKYNDEINILDIFSILLKKRLKILYIIITCIFIMLVFQLNFKNSKVLYLVETNVKSISSFEEIKYANFNNFYDNMKKTSDGVVYLNNNQSDSINTNLFNLQTRDFSSNQYFPNISKSYLLNLLIEKLSDHSSITKSIISNNLLDVGEFNNKNDYEKFIDDIIINYKIIKSVNQDNQAEEAKIIFTTDLPEKWIGLLIKLEKQLNLEIQRFLFENFENLIANEILIRKFKVEDLNAKLINPNISEELKKVLLIYKIELSNKKDIYELEKFFKKTPVYEPEDFRAGHVLNETSKFKQIKGTLFDSTPKMIILTIFISGIFAVFIVLIEHAIKKKIS